MERISLEDAVNLLISVVKTQTKTEELPLLMALDKIVAEDIYAPISVPTFNRAAMDGYAVIATDTKGATPNDPIKLSVVKQVMAGDTTSINASTNQAVRVMTGSLIPDGFDAVVRQEDTNYGEDEVEIYTTVSEYTNYSKIGEDIMKGQLMTQKGTRLTAIHLGILASLGFDKVKVISPMRVGLINTGSELVQAPHPLKQGQIYDSNQTVLLARLKELNVEVSFFETVADDTLKAVNLIKDKMSDIDLLLTTGGVSVGKKDIMHDVTKQLHAKRLFWKINMRPGTPILASIYEEKLILSLSGNPFAALTTFELLFRPILANVMNHDNYIPLRKKARFNGVFDKASKQRRFIRAFYEDGEVFLKTPEHASSVLSSMIGCNCFIDIEAGNTGLNHKDEVDIVLI